MQTLTQEMTRDWIESIVETESVLRALTRDITIPAHHWKPALDASHKMRKLRKDLLGLAVVQVEVVS